MAALNFFRGDTWHRVFRWRQDGVSVDLTGCTGRCQLRHPQTLTLVLEASSVTVDGPNGEVSVKFSAASTQNIASAEYALDVELTFPDGTVQSTGAICVQVYDTVTQ